MRNVVASGPGIKRFYGNLPTLSDYGKMLSDFDLLIRSFRALAIPNVVLLGEVDYRRYEDELIRPLFIGRQTSTQICQEMDIIGFLETEEREGETQRQILFDSSRVVAKDRTDRLPNVVVKPTYEKLIQYIRQETVRPGAPTAFGGNDE